MDWSTAITLITVLGGIELVKFIVNYKDNKKVVHSQALESEFKILKDIIQFLQTEVEDKTKQIRKLNQDLCDTYSKDVAQEREIGELKIELAKYKPMPSEHVIAIQSQEAILVPANETNQDGNL